MSCYDYVSPRFPPRCAKGGNGRLDSRQRERGARCSSSRLHFCSLLRDQSIARLDVVVDQGRHYNLVDCSRARGSTDSVTRPLPLRRLGSSSLPSTSMLKQPMSLKRYTRTLLFSLELTSIPSAHSLTHPRKWV